MSVSIVIFSPANSLEAEEFWANVSRVVTTVVVVLPDVDVCVEDVVPKLRLVRSLVIVLAANERLPEIASILPDEFVVDAARVALRPLIVRSVSARISVLVLARLPSSG